MDKKDISPRNERDRALVASARRKALRNRTKLNSNGFVGKNVHGFMHFVREQGVVGLAVGLTLGTAVTVLVKSIVDDVINPFIGALMPGTGQLSEKYTCLTYNSGECVNRLGWGRVASNFISFVTIAAVVYFVVKGLKFDKLDIKKDK